MNEKNCDRREIKLKQWEGKKKLEIRNKGEVEEMKAASVPFRRRRRSNANKVSKSK